MKTSRLAHGANPCGATHPCASASARPARSGRRLIHVIAILCLALIGKTASAASVDLVWDPNPETDIAGYNLCYGTSSGNYTTTLPNGTSNSASVSGLIEGKTYYFAVKAVNASGYESAPSAEVVYQVPVPGTSPGSPLSQAGWTLQHVSSEEAPAYAAALAFDGNPYTFWHTSWVNTVSPPPYEIVIDLGLVQSVGGFRYLPRQDSYDVGNIAQYEFYVSMDGSNWGSPLASGVFANSKNEKEVLFAGTSGRYVKLRGITEVNGKSYCNVAELNIIQGGTISEPPAPANQVPVANSQTKITAEDNSVAITLAASDADGDLLAYSIISGPTMGQLTGTAPNLTYTPAANANGTDSFTFRVNDGEADSNIATVSITVTAVNDVPVAVAQVASTPEDKALGILLSASDKDGDSLGYRIVSAPAKGSLSGAAPNLTYTPAADVNGSDSFSFVANDGRTDSNIATVSITITAVNDAPVAVAQTVSTQEDKSLGIILSATDKDGDPLVYQIASGPSKGSLSGTAPNLTYVPNLNASGTDSFSFRVNDGKADSNTASVSINITAVNDAPVASAQVVSATVGTPVAIVLSASDVDGDSLGYSVTGSPFQGSLSGTPPNLSYTPFANASGTDYFTFRASDGKATSNTAVITINITAAQKTDNKSPAFTADLITRADGKVNQAYTATSLAGSAVDPEGSAVSYSKSAGPAWLIVSTDGQITGTPGADAEGLNSFTIRAADPSGAYDEAVLQITVLPPDLPLPWNLGRIGSLSQDSTAWGDLVALKLKSSGSLASTADAGIFTWQTLSGDGEITARISTLESANSSSRIGLEIRESLATNAKHVFVGADGAGNIYLISRTKTGGATSISKLGVGRTPDLWLRLNRSGNSINVFTSSNGSTWSRAGKVNTMMDISNYIGLMTSGGETNLSTGVFQNVNVKP